MGNYNLLFFTALFFSALSGSMFALGKTLIGFLSMGIATTLLLIKWILQSEWFEKKMDDFELDLIEETLSSHDDTYSEKNVARIREARNNGKTN